MELWNIGLLDCDTIFKILITITAIYATWVIFKKLFISIYLYITAFLVSKTVKIYQRFMDKRKVKLFTPIADTLCNLTQPLKILDVGSGSGENFKYFPNNSEITCLEPNEHFQKYLSENAQKYPHVKIDKIVVGYGEDMKDISDNSMDVVVTTLVMCTVQNMQKTLQEIKRVLKPGGRYYYMEHVASQTTPLLVVQKLLKVFWYCMWDGCVLDRNIGKIISQAGFKSVKQEEFFAEIYDPTLYIVRPHVMGVAEK